VAAALHAAGRALPGVTGGTASTAEFVQAWASRTGQAATLNRAEGLHVLDTLVPPVGVTGRARPAGPADAALCTDWGTAFEREAVPDRALSREHVERSVARRIEQGTLLLWDDGARPVSLAGRHLPAAGVSRIGPVYTPPDQRRHGYAAAVTAAASEAALAAGAEHVMLFTDLANPTSNGVYARIGYRRVGEASEWIFDPAR
jgi:GNAT superfamily N-acetyltransferase